jgi:hypothetical protein
MQEARAIARDAWLYAYAPLENYKSMYDQAVNKDFPGYIGGFNRFRHYSRMSTPQTRTSSLRTMTPPIPGRG